MKLTMILSTLLLGTVAQAAAVPAVQTPEKVFLSQTSCANAVAASDVWVASAFRQTIEVTSVDSPEMTKRFVADDSVTDLLVEGETLYVLTRTTIEVWNLTTGTRVSSTLTSNDEQPADYQAVHAMGFAKEGNLLVIAHGRQGLTLFDLEQTKIVHQARLLEEQLPWESEMRDVTIVDGKAIFAVSNYHVIPHIGEGAFRGAIVYDLKTRKTLSIVKGLDPGVSSLERSGDVLLFNYENFFWKVSAQDLITKERLRVQNRVFRFPMKGHPTGKMQIRPTTIMSCFLKAPEPGQGRSYQRVPVVLNRAELML